jgi:hypothetical protein
VLGYRAGFRLGKGVVALGPEAVLRQGVWLEQGTGLEQGTELEQGTGKGHWAELEHGVRRTLSVVLQWGGVVP